MARAELEGWKAIARYFERSVRQVQEWERKSGLPVNRRQGRVYAYVDVLEAWKEDRHRAGKRRRGRRVSWGGAALVSTVILAGVVVAGFPKPQVADARFKGRVLEALDHSGEVLWSHTFPSRIIRTVDPRPSLLVLDVDQDQIPEIIVDDSPSTLSKRGGRLVCFDDDGSVLWALPHGGPLKVGDREFGPYFGDAFLHEVQLASETLLLAVTRHATWYPAHFALRRPATGELVDEYWHPGYVYDTEIGDFDRDGEPELLFGGINNPGDGLGYPAMGLLDLPFGRPRNPEGSPPNFLAPANAREAAYWLFPQPDTFRAMRHGAGVLSLVPQAEGTLRVSLGMPVDKVLHYYLDPDFQIRDLRAASSYQAAHNGLTVQGFLDHAFSSSELAGTRRLVPLATAPNANSADIREILETSDSR